MMNPRRIKKELNCNCETCQRKKHELKKKIVNLDIHQNIL